MAPTFVWKNEIATISKMVTAIIKYGVNTIDENGFHLLNLIARMPEEQADVLLSFKPNLVSKSGNAIWTTYFIVDIGYSYVQKLIACDKDGVYVKKRLDGKPNILELTIKGYNQYMKSDHPKLARDIKFYEDKIRWLKEHQMRFENQIHETTALLDDMQLA